MWSQLDSVSQRVASGLAAGSLTTLLTVAWAPSAAAIDTDLRQPGDSTTAELNIQNKHLNGGAPLHDDVVLEGALDIRRYEFGLRLDAIMALGKSVDGIDGTTDTVGFGEVVELKFRGDYLYETGNIQLIPYLETSLYPAYGTTLIDEPWWAGAELWYLMPFEGWEIGASFAGDLGGNHGVQGSVASRQFWQQAPLDVRLWQAVNLGSQEYHEWTSGAKHSGFTDFEVGGELTIPLPYEGAWAGLLAEVHYWPATRDQDALPREVEWIIAFNTTWEF
jgi:hypothetical protein